MAIKPVVKKPAARSKFAAFRDQMKKKQEVANSPGVKIQVEEEKVFTAGFFSVASPVRTPKPHCEGMVDPVYKKSNLNGIWC